MATITGGRYYDAKSANLESRYEEIAHILTNAAGENVVIRYSIPKGIVATTEGSITRIGPKMLIWNVGTISVDDVIEKSFSVSSKNAGEYVLGG